MVGADVTSADARAHCPRSETVDIDVRDTSVATARLMVRLLSGALQAADALVASDAEGSESPKARAMK